MSAATGHARLSDEQRVFVSLDLCAAKVGTFSARGGTARAGGGGGGGGVCLWNLQTQGRTVMLHGLSNKEFNGRHGVCGFLFPLKPQAALCRDGPQRQRQRAGAAGSNKKLACRAGAWRAGSSLQGSP